MANDIGDYLWQGLARANAQMAKSDDPIKNVGTALAEGTATGLNLAGTAYTAATDEPHPEMTGKTFGKTLTYLAGGENAEQAGEEKITLSNGEETTIKEMPGMDIAEGARDVVEGAGKTLMMGLLAEAWNTTAGMFSNPVSSVANTISQVENITNAKDI